MLECLLTLYVELVGAAGDDGELGTRLIVHSRLTAQAAVSQATTT
jgi:hypothetical protein